MLLEASGSTIFEAEKVEVVLAGLSSDFDAVLTLASFSSEPLSFQKLVDVLMEFESRQLRAMLDASMHAHLVESSSTTAVIESNLRDVRGRSASGSRGRGFRPRVQSLGSDQGFGRAASMQNNNSRVSCRTKPRPYVIDFDSLSCIGLPVFLIFVHLIFQPPLSMGPTLIIMIPMCLCLLEPRPSIQI